MTTRVWDAVVDYEPEAWYWLGDAVYVRSFSERDVLHAAYSKQRYETGYAVVADQVDVVDGTWDDHDLGVNDGGAEVPWMRGRQEEFLEFIGKAQVPRRAARDGVYSAHKICNDAACGQSVGLVFLDTRTHKALPASGYNVGAIRLPLFGLAGSLARAATAALGWFAQGTILGDVQWEWLEELLRKHRDDVDAWLIVSSIQVNTSIPLFESWGHHPEEKRRLLRALNGSKSVLFISGDVHFSEIGAHEITTSGITHSCETQFALPLCSPVLKHFTQHRRAEGEYYAGLSFLGADLAFPEDEVRFTVRGVDNTAALSYTLPLGRPTIFEAHAAAPQFRVAEIAALLSLACAVACAAVALLWRGLRRAWGGGACKRKQD